MFMVFYQLCANALLVELLDQLLCCCAPVRVGKPNAIGSDFDRWVLHYQDMLRRPSAHCEGCSREVGYTCESG